MVFLMKTSNNADMSMPKVFSLHFESFHFNSLFFFIYHYLQLKSKNLFNKLCSIIWKKSDVQFYISDEQNMKLRFIILNFSQFFTLGRQI